MCVYGLPLKSDCWRSLSRGLTTPTLGGEDNDGVMVNRDLLWILLLLLPSVAGRCTKEREGGKKKKKCSGSDLVMIGRVFTHVRLGRDYPPFSFRLV